MVNGTKPANTPNLVCPTSSPSLSSPSPSPINSMDPSQEVPVNLSTDAIDASKEMEQFRPPEPTSMATGAGGAECQTLYTRTARQRADTRLRTRSQPCCKLDSSNVIETESQRSSPSKRLRTTFTPHQTAILEKEYALHSQPSREIRLEIAQELQLNEHVIANWFQNRRGRDVANKNAAARPDTVDEATKKEVAVTPNGAVIGRKCTPTTTSVTVAKPQPVVRPAASRPKLPPPFMQNRFPVSMYPRNVPHSGAEYDARSDPTAHQVGPTMHVSFLDDFSTCPIQQQRWGMQVELKSSDSNLPNLLGTGMLHGSKKGIKLIIPEVVITPSMPLRLPLLRTVRPVPSPELPPHGPIPTSNHPPPAERPDPKSLPPVAQSATPMPPPSVPEIPVERPSLPVPPKNVPLLVSKTTGADISPHPTRVSTIRNRRCLSRAMSLEYYAGMMEKNRSPRTLSVSSAGPKDVHRTPVKRKDDAPLWVSMVSSPPSPTSPGIRQVDMERLKPLVKWGRTKSLEFACALARVQSSDLKNACGAPGMVGAKRKRLEDLLLEPRGRKVKKIRRTFSSGVKETQKESRGLRKVASIAAIPLSQSETKEKEMQRPIGLTETCKPDLPLSGSSFISDTATLAISDNETCSSTLNASPQSLVEIKVTDWGLNARDKENRKPEVTVKDLERNAVQVLASMMGTRV